MQRRQNCFSRDGNRGRQTTTQCLPPLPMALLSNRKRLTCHYCNTKSRIIQNGSVFIWQCTSCGQTNYLDQNGDIADPPVAQESETAGRSESILADPFFIPNQRRGDDPFCSTCLNNQRILQSALSELDVELDEDHPDYNESGRAFEQSRKKLEQLYPQVCSQCAEIATQRIMKTKYTAQADYFGRGLRKTERARSRANSPWSRAVAFLTGGVSRTYRTTQNMTLYDFTLAIAPRLRYYGQLLGLLFHFASLLVSLQCLAVWYTNDSTIIEEWLLVNAGSAIAQPIQLVALNAYGLLIFIAISLPCAQLGILMSFASCWWNPYFKEWSRGFTQHLSGFQHWYTVTYSSLLARALIWNYLTTNIWDGPFVIVPIASHAVALILITTASQAQVKRDMNALFQTSPNRLPKSNISHRNIAPDNTDIGDALEAIRYEPSRQEPTTAPFPPISRTATLPFQGKANVPITKAQYDPHDDYDSRRFTPISTENEFRQRRQPGTFHEAFSHRRQASVHEEMEWTPTESQHRAFKNDVPDSRATESFNKAPVGDEQSPFWYKVPQAPISQAERILKQRQPPNFRPTSQEVKENFFHTITKRDSVVPQNRSRRNSSSSAEEEHGFVMAPPKFFPSTGNDFDDSLADCFGGITLTEAPPEHPKTRAWRASRLLQFVILCFAFLLWNVVPLIPSNLADCHALGAMSLCCFVGFAVVPEHYGTMFKHGYRPKRPVLTHLLLASLGICEMLVGALLILICLTNVSTFPLQTGGHASCWSAGNILIGSMLAQEFFAWYF
ncbi:Integral inner nuclear membrane protein ima1 [Phlyctema vagabunda]|uniref:Integral inner nuclear membrane protein ima1 n=1 Tax=Phlyctema vagabunda TaxID=108571 RepID=A0ABR4PWI3_9HELO